MKSIYPLEIPAFVQHWVAQLCPQSNNIKKLRGGINNQVYSFGGATKQWVIKGYPISKLGEYDRLHAELNFLRYAAEVAPGLTPSLTAFDFTHRCLIFDYVEGQLYTNNQPLPYDALKAAGNFFYCLNKNLSEAKSYNLPAASEGYLRITEHLANISKRISEMHPRLLDIHFRSSATRIYSELRNQLNHLNLLIQEALGQDQVTDTLDRSQLCVSPSDFGFHNALLTPNGPVFLDFEFAGWDDPCKASLDFMLQPRIPTGVTGTYLLDLLSENHPSSFQRRCHYLEPILRLKWIAIILSILNPARLSEIVSASCHLNPQLLIQERLSMAEKAMQAFHLSLNLKF